MRTQVWSLVHTHLEGIPLWVSHPVTKGASAVPKRLTVRTSCSILPVYSQHVLFSSELSTTPLPSWSEVYLLYAWSSKCFHYRPRTEE